MAGGHEGDRPAVWASEDGDGWSMETLPGEGSVIDLIAHQDRLVAVSLIGDSAEVWVGRPEGPWERAEVSGVPSALFSDGSAVYGAGWVRPEGLDHDGLLLSSPDGLGWRVDERSAALGGPGDQLANALQVISDGYLHIGGQDNGRASIWQSAEGSVWQVDPRLFPQESHISLFVQAADTTLAIGGVERSTGPDVLLWCRAEPVAASPEAVAAADCPK